MKKVNSKVLSVYQESFLTTEESNNLNIKVFIHKTKIF